MWNLAVMAMSMREDLVWISILTFVVSIEYTGRYVLDNGNSRIQISYLDPRSMDYKG